MFYSALLLLCLASFSQCDDFDKVGGQIVNGDRVQPSEIPYQIALFISRNTFNFCGGSLINAYYVVTAAHCVANRKPENIHLVAGTVNLNKSGYIRTIKEIIVHEEYDSGDSWRNDIALLILFTPLLSVLPGIGYVSLPKQNEYIEAGELAIVSGFGRIEENGPSSHYLLQARISTANQEYCKVVYKEVLHNIYDSHICAYNTGERTGACNGDSGGPLTVNGKLVGIVSWSVGCARTDFPTVFTRVPSYIDWIKKNVFFTY